MKIENTSEKPSKLAIFLNKLGYKNYSYNIILIDLIAFAYDGFHLTLASNMIIPIKQYYNMSTFWVEISSAIIFLGLAVGSLFLKNMVDFIGGRKNLYKLGTVVVMVGHLGLFISNNHIVFTIARFISGIGVSWVTIVGIALICEGIPLSSRALAIGIGFTSYSLFQAICCMVMISIMPNFEPENTPKVLIIMFIILLGLSFYGFFAVPNSIEDMINKKNYVEAYKILNDITYPEKITKEFFLELTKDQLLLKIQENDSASEKTILIPLDTNKKIIYSNSEDTEFQDYMITNLGTLIIKDNDNNMFSHVNVLFEEKYLFITTCIILICTTCAGIFYGPLLIQSITMIALIEKNIIAINSREIILTNFYIALSLIIANPIGGLISESKLFGRKYTIFFAYLICLISTGVVLYDIAYYRICQSLILFVSTIGFNAFITYYSELYPSEIKETSISFFSFLMRIGGFISQFVFLIFFSSYGYNFAYIVEFILLCFTVVVSYILPSDIFS